MQAAVRCPARARLDQVELVPDAEAHERGAVHGGLQHARGDRVAELLEDRSADVLQRGARGRHGRTAKKASAGSLPMVGTTRARSRYLLNRSHEHSAM